MRLPGPLTYSKLRWWCSYIPTTSSNTLLALMVVTPLQLALHDGLFLEALVHILHAILQLALCGSGGGGGGGGVVHGAWYMVPWGGGMHVVAVCGPI